MKKLDVFWRHCNRDTAMKMYTAEPVLRPKLFMAQNQRTSYDVCQKD